MDEATRTERREKWAGTVKAQLDRANARDEAILLLLHELGERQQGTQDATQALELIERLTPKQ